MYFYNFFMKIKRVNWSIKSIITIISIIIINTCSFVTIFIIIFIIWLLIVLYNSILCIFMIILWKVSVYVIN